MNRCNHNTLNHRVKSSVFYTHLASHTVHSDGPSLIPWSGLHRKHSVRTSQHDRHQENNPYSTHGTSHPKKEENISRNVWMQCYMPQLNKGRPLSGRVRTCQACNSWYFQLYTYFLEAQMKVNKVIPSLYMNCNGITAKSKRFRVKPSPSATEALEQAKTPGHKSNRRRDVTKQYAASSFLGLSIWMIPTKDNSYQ